MSTESSDPYDFAPEKPAEGAAPAQTVPVKKSPVEAAVARKPLVERLCPQCGLRIMGKPRNNCCPECRAPLDESAADLLQFSFPGWIRKLSWGALAVALAVPAHVAGALLTRAASEPVMGAGLQVVGAALAAAGIWILTTPEEGMPQRRAALALVARWLAIARDGPFGDCTGIGGAGPGAQGSVTGLAVVTMAAEAVAFGLFASSLAARIPHDGLTNQLRNFALLLPLFLMGVLVSLFNDLSPYYAAFFCAFPLIGGLLGLMAWVTATMLRLMLELRHVATAADAIVLKRFQKVQAAPVTKKM